MSQSPQGKRADPRLGMVLSDRYRIVRKLGDGGMGSVYEGEHLMIKRRVAIKVLHSQFAENPEIVARFHREAQAANDIGHPNIVEVTDMGRFDDGTTYMVLEYLEGRDWAYDIKQQGAQPLGKCVHILDQVCDALEAAHGKGIVHRDLKPENVFLVPFRDDPNFAKVLDFGISKIMDEAVGDRSLTQTGTALGTPYYMAPEQCQGKKDVDLRADIYSLGVMLFQALTAQYPFDDETYPMLVLKICTEPPPALTRFRPDVPIEVEHIVNKMLAKHRAHRFASCAEVRAALRPFLGHDAAPVLADDAPVIATQGPSVLAGVAGGGAVTPTGTAILEGAAAPPTGTPYPAEAPRSSAPLMLAVGGAIGLMVLAGVGLGAWVALSQDDDATTTVAGEPTAPVEGPADAPPDEPPSAAPDEGTAEPPVEGTAEPPTAPAVAAPAREHVLLVVQPEGTPATIALDGVTVSHDGSYEGDIAPGPHEIRVTADGYVTYEDRIDPPADARFSIPLRRERRASSSHRPPPARPPSAPTPQPLPVTPPPSSTGSTGGGARSGGSETVRPPGLGGGRRRTLRPGQTGR